MRNPTNLELLDFFGVEPIQQGDATFFNVSDNNGVELSLSYSDIDDSLQTSLAIGGRLVAVVCQEGLSRFWIAEGKFCAEFKLQANRIHLEVKLLPFIQIEWSGLRTS